MKNLKSVIFILFLAVSSVIFYVFALIIWMLTYLFDKRKVLQHKYTCLWSSIYTFFLPGCSLVIKGREKLDKSKTYIIVSNHQSQLDAMVMYRLNAHFKWVAKSEVFRMPFIGWNMTLNKYISITRGNKNSIEKMMSDCRKAIKEGNSVFIFPEGTRTIDGTLRSFKLGAFLLAKEAGVPILPITISGTMDALPKYSLMFNKKTKIVINVLDEIPYNSFKDVPAEVLASEVREIIAKEVVFENK